MKFGEADREAVKVIQQALRDLNNARIGSLPISFKTGAPDGIFGNETTAAVQRLQEEFKIEGSLNQNGVGDGRLGRHTLAKLDTFFQGLGPSPGPAPAPPPPVVGAAGVQIGPLGPGRGARFVREYYNKCGLETIGPGQVATSGLREYSTLEELMDVLQARPEPQQVIVNHGDPDRGLILPCARETTFSDTGKVIFLLSGLADRQEEKGRIDPANPIDKVLLDGAARDMRVPQSVVLRIVGKLVPLRKKQLVLHFRACNLTDLVMLGAYKKAFGARMITFHPVRLLFLRFILDQMKAGQSVADFSSDKNTAKARLRTFDDPIGLLSPMMLAINDIDGHTRVEQVSFIERRSPEQILGWAIFLLRQWREAAPEGFVVPIMWDNRELTFHCPLEEGWRKKLQFV